MTVARSASTSAGLYHGPGGSGEYWLPRDLKAWETAWGVVPGAIPADDTGTRQPLDMSPEAVEARRIAKARHDEAVRYVRDYTGSWGLPLDIRANPRWGTKHLRLTVGQVDALLRGRDRDAGSVADRLAFADANPDVVAYLSGYTGSSDFVLSIRQQLMTRGSLSDRQVEAVRSNIAREPGPAPVARPDRPAPAPVTEVEPGWYVVDDQPWKVQLAVHGSGKPYAKRLNLVTSAGGDKVGSWEYVPGGLSVIRQHGQPMTVEQATAFGHLYGVCGVCGKTLTDEKSIAAGIGPVCLARIQNGG